MIQLSLELRSWIGYALGASFLPSRIDGRTTSLTPTFDLHQRNQRNAEDIGKRGEELHQRNSSRRHSSGNLYRRLQITSISEEVRGYVYRFVLHTNLKLIL